MEQDLKSSTSDGIIRSNFPGQQRCCRLGLSRFFSSVIVSCYYPVYDFPSLLCLALAPALARGHLASGVTSMGCFCFRLTCSLGCGSLGRE